MRILLLAASASELLAGAVIEVDETFQLSNDDDRTRLLDYVVDNSDISTSDSVLTILAADIEPPVFVDQDGSTLDYETLALPPREEASVDPADILSAREPTDD